MLEILGVVQLDKNATQAGLRTEMTYARKAYELSRLELVKASQMACELGLSNPDGAHALRSASMRYHYLLGQYSKTVRRLALFMRTGITAPLP
jgi:hypothetical protein